MSSNSKNKIWAVVPAAGCGQRMQSATPKQYLEIQGKTILATTLEVLASNTEIDHIVVAIAADDQRWVSLDLSQPSKISNTIGGATRAQSVLNGLQAVAEQANDADWVLVHDAARPCLAASLLATLIATLKDDAVGGILALPAQDTLKASNDGGVSIEKTIDRSTIWCAQTPQMFRYGLLKQALATANSEHAAITDEASAIELLGHKVKLVLGDARNIKITTDDDFQLAKLLLGNHR